MPILLQLAIGLGTLLIVAGGIAGGYAAFKSSRNTSIISNYETAVKSWKERSTSQDNEINALKEQATQREAAHAAELTAIRDSAADDRKNCASQFSELKGRYDTLSDMVTGASAILKLETTLSQHFDELSGRLSILETLANNNKPVETERIRRPKGQPTDG